MSVRLHRNLEIAMKRVTSTQAEGDGTSNQHEFNSADSLKQMFGRRERRWPDLRWIIFEGDGRRTVELHGMTWYDSRSEPRSEWRFYYAGPSTVSDGDLLTVLRWEGTSDIEVVITRPGTTWEAQLLAIAGAQEVVPGRKGHYRVVGEIDEIYWPAFSSLLSEIGWDDLPVSVDDDSLVHRALEDFGWRFPSRFEFSKFVYDHADVDKSDPDELLLRLFQEEERLFLAFEEKVTMSRIEMGFNKFSEFIDEAHSVINRRKSRAGGALENHLEFVFNAFSIPFTRNGTTEGSRKPDFIFPGIEYYRDMSFRAGDLTMLGAKTSCKDRWRQVLSEARRVWRKHLCTVDPKLSTGQMTEMMEERLVVVAPERIRETYSPPAGYEVLSIKDFIALVRRRYQQAGL